MTVKRRTAALIIVAFLLVTCPPYVWAAFQADPLALDETQQEAPTPKRRGLFSRSHANANVAILAHQQAGATPPLARGT